MDQKLEINMKHFRYILTGILVSVVVLGGCEISSDVGAPPSNGSINNTMFVSIGNSLTAGFQSGVLKESNQRYSFPNLIAQQLGIPSDNFVQPIIPDPGIGTPITITSLNPPALETGMAATNPSNSTHPRPFNNLGIPGAILFDALDTSSIQARSATRGNPFYMVVMRNQAAFGKSMIEQATKLGPTFMTFWLGNNDVLGYATSGGTKGTNLGLGGTTPRTLPTEKLIFKQLFEGSLTALMAFNPNANIVVANIPNVTDVPFFTTVPIKIPNPTDPNKLLDIYYKKNDGTVAVAQPGDYVLLTAQAVIGTGPNRSMGLHPLTPLDSKYVLDAGEVAIASKAVQDFNEIIRNFAQAKNIPLVDINAEFARIKAEGYNVAGQEFTTDFITGGLFSLDGVHPSSRGYGIVANMFIKKMNEAFNANIPFVDVIDLPGIPIPSGKIGKGYQPGMTIAPGTFDAMISMFLGE